MRVPLGGIILSRLNIFLAPQSGSIFLPLPKLSLSLSLSLSLLCFLPPVDVGRRSARRSFCLGAPSSALTSPSGTHADRRVRPLPPPRLCSPLPSCGGDGGDGDYEHNFLLVCRSGGKGKGRGREGERGSEGARHEAVKEPTLIESKH